jgi:hypothetical protein
MVDSVYSDFDATKNRNIKTYGYMYQDTCQFAAVANLLKTGDCRGGGNVPNETKRCW